MFLITRPVVYACLREDPFADEISYFVDVFRDDRHLFRCTCSFARHIDGAFGQRHELIYAHVWYAFNARVQRKLRVIL